MDELDAVVNEIYGQEFMDVCAELVVGFVGTKRI
jgi:hypothetical protein